ncbi:uncharacterized protein FIBRA_02754 [Fibroporia radiculosa]|uniref:Uncharacterized protein n=1 Tax=Fibroporia radiculosa TaxID=599839 RepID=J4H211_9APHY|nr:uncharacterized protein FIBRA_02754 [Fibroporia radiculosa]CCM00714.1 predicted protein [Fibroporia radiculosa]
MRHHSNLRKFFDLTTLSSSEPRQAPKPQPMGNFPLIFLFTTCALCAVFLLWRRASALRTVVAHQLNTWTRKEGAVRLSEDDGPPAHEFLDDDYDDDRERIPDDEPLAAAIERTRSNDAGQEVFGTASADAVDPSRNAPPTPPPKP